MRSDSLFESFGITGTAKGVLQRAYEHYVSIYNGQESAGSSGTRLEDLGEEMTLFLLQVAREYAFLGADPPLPNAASKSSISPLALFYPKIDSVFKTLVSEMKDLYETNSDAGSVSEDIQGTVENDVGAELLDATGVFFNENSTKAGKKALKAHLTDSLVFTDNDTRQMVYKAISTSTKFVIKDYLSTIEALYNYGLPGVNIKAVLKMPKKDAIREIKRVYSQEAALYLDSPEEFDPTEVYAPREFAETMVALYGITVPAADPSEKTELFLESLEAKLLAEFIQDERRNRDDDDDDDEDDEIDTDEALIEIRELIAALREVYQDDIPGEPQVREVDLTIKAFKGTFRTPLTITKTSDDDKDAWKATMMAQLIQDHPRIFPEGADYKVRSKDGLKVTVEYTKKADHFLVVFKGPPEVTKDVVETAYVKSGTKVSRAFSGDSDLLADPSMRVMGNLVLNLETPTEEPEFYEAQYRYKGKVRTIEVPTGSTFDEVVEMLKEQNAKFKDLVFSTDDDWSQDALVRVKKPTKKYDISIFVDDSDEPAFFHEKLLTSTTDEAVREYMQDAHPELGEPAHIGIDDDGNVVVEVLTEAEEATVTVTFMNTQEARGESTMVVQVPQGTTAEGAIGEFLGDYPQYTDADFKIRFSKELTRDTRIRFTVAEEAPEEVVVTFVLPGAEEAVTVANQGESLQIVIDRFLEARPEFTEGYRLITEASMDAIVVPGVRVNVEEIMESDQDVSDFGGDDQADLEEEEVFVEGPDGILASMMICKSCPENERLRMLHKEAGLFGDQRLKKIAPKTYQVSGKAPEEAPEEIKIDVDFLDGSASVSAMMARGETVADLEARLGIKIVNADSEDSLDPNFTYDSETFKMAEVAKKAHKEPEEIMEVFYQTRADQDGYKSVQVVVPANAADLLVAVEIAEGIQYTRVYNQALQDWAEVADDEEIFDGASYYVQSAKEARKDMVNEEEPVAIAMVSLPVRVYLDGQDSYRDPIEVPEGAKVAEVRRAVRSAYPDLKQAYIKWDPKRSSEIEAHFFETAKKVPGRPRALPSKARKVTVVQSVKVPTAIIGRDEYTMLTRSTEVRADADILEVAVDAQQTTAKSQMIKMALELEGLARTYRELPADSKNWRLLRMSLYQLYQTSFVLSAEYPMHYQAYMVLIAEDPASANVDTAVPELLESLYRTYKDRAAYQDAEENTRAHIDAQMEKEHKIATLRMDRMGHL